MYIRCIALFIVMGLMSSANAAPPIGFIKGQVEKVQSLLKIPVRTTRRKKKK